MRSSACSLRAAGAALFLAAFVAAAAPFAPAPARADKTTIHVHVPDSIVVDVPDAPAVPAPPGTVRKKIVIGGSGVRITDEGVVAEIDSNGINFDFDVDVDAEDTGEDIVRVGESVFVAPDQTVAGDVVVFGGNAIIEGTVAGSVVVLGGEIRVRRGAEIKGDIVAIGGTIEEDEEVVIRGEKILVGGVASRLGDSLDVSTRTLRVVATIVLLFVAFILFFITMLFLRARVERVSEHVFANMLKCFGAGVLTSVIGTFALLIVMVPLIITIVGIPLAVVLAISCIGIYVIACTAFVYTVGRAVASRAGLADGVFVRLFLGIAVLVVPELIAFVIDAVGGPMGAYVLFKIVSAFLWLFAYVVGLGAIVTSRFGSRPAQPAPPATHVAGEPAGVPAA